MEIIIGRQVTNPQDITIPEDEQRVSRKHAKIVIDENNILLEDLDSANGTFVNGIRIKKKFISASDQVSLGDIDGYKLNVEDVIDLYNKINYQNKTDFTQEFVALKEVYNGFLISRNKLKKQSGFKSFLPRILVTLSGIAIVMLIPMGSDTRYIIMTILGLLGGASTLIKGDDLKLQDKLDQLNVTYQNKYLCPKCKKKLGLQNSWNLLKSNHVCPHKCGAVYSEEDFVQSN